MGGAIDVGSNSVHLLVAVTGAGWLEPLRDTSELLGLGDTVDRYGEIPTDARARLVEVVRTYADTAHRSHAERLTLIGTEPLRRARNADAVIEEIHAATGFTLRVLNEREEALLTFAGVTRGLAPLSPLIVVDIGGGSTEFSISIPGQPLRIEGLALGSARLTNAVVEHDPPTDEELDRLFSAASAATAAVELGVGSDAARSQIRAVFVGGTATNVARLGRLSRAQLADDRRTLSSMSVAAITTRFSVRPRRARQLAAGVAIVDALLESLRA